MKVIISKSAEQTKQIGAKLAGLLKPGDVVALFGSLGMGKTAFVKGLASELGIKEEAVSSPTYSLVHDYGGNPPLYHFDMYRVVTWDDLYSTGFFDYIDAGGILAVEWSENIEDALPDKIIKVEFERGQSDNERIIKITGDNIDENFCG